MTDIKTDFWDYKGYRKMNLHDVDQYDWNATLLTVINRVFGDIDSKKKVFVSYNLMDIFESIVGYDKDTNVIYDKYYIETLMMTSDILYVTDMSVKDFKKADVNKIKMIKVDNYG